MKTNPRGCLATLKTSLELFKINYHINSELSGYFATNFKLILSLVKICHWLYKEQKQTAFIYGEKEDKETSIQIQIQILNKRGNVQNKYKNIVEKIGILNTNGIQKTNFIIFNLKIDFDKNQFLKPPNNDYHLTFSSMEGSTKSINHQPKS